MPAVPATINFDADLVSLSSMGKTVEVYACDFVDEVNEVIDHLNETEPLPDKLDDETGETIKGSHGRGAPFIAVLVEQLKCAGLDVKPRKAIAIWRSLISKTEEYASFFENGPNSRPSSEQHHPESLADVAASALQSKKADGSEPVSD
jgi:hypothetical protein